MIKEDKEKENPNNYKIMWFWGVASMNYAMLSLIKIYGGTGR